jgi:hypothetical protein
VVSLAIALASTPITTNARTSLIIGHQTPIKRFVTSFTAQEANYTPEPPKVAQTAPKTPVVDNNDAKMFIYHKESGNRPTARNASGCLGLGQACPGSKLLAVCPDLNDYACQDAFFTNYALSRYGSWENAKAFWLAHKWW